MKTKITRPDGTVIRVEGEPDEVAEVVRRLTDSEPVTIVPYPWGYPAPVSIPSPFWVQPDPEWRPFEITWTCGVGTAAGDAPVTTEINVDGGHFRGFVSDWGDA